MDKITKICVILLIVCIIAVGFCFYAQHLSFLNMDNACKSLGYDKYKYENYFEFCADSEDNLHYIKMNCDWIGFNCNAKLIKVGQMSISP